MKETVVYLRTSSSISSGMQNPENQLKDCLELVNKLGIKDYEILEEQKSAYKEIERPIFNEIEKNIRRGIVKNIICWDYDRLFRNRIKTIEFIRNYSKLGLKVYSFRQQWFEEIDKIPSPWNEMMHDLLLQVISWMGEEESSKRSSRIKNSVRRNEGVTKSYKGNKWGRKRKNVDENYILELHAQGLSSYEISKKYNEDKNNKNKISHMTVFKIIKKSNN